ncbi:MAG: hypothetical protein PHR52_13895, partial [Fermentimonas sp.]|nr:hypothetical protein [Dysgonamonadaceae bacterium]MDD4698606.1 hypothetical protein [Fermentimonas sp.]
MKSKNILVLLVFALCVFITNAQSPWERIAERPSTLFMDQGESKFTTNSFRLSLVDASQTVK